MSDFDSHVDDLIRALQDETCQEPFLVQLRAAMNRALEAVNEQNIEQVGKVVDGLLSHLDHQSGKPVTFVLLMSRMAKANQLPQNIMALTTKLANSNINEGGPTKAQSAALGLVVASGFTPSPGNPFYYAGWDFGAAAKFISSTFKGARGEAARLIDLNQHRPGDFKTYIMKMKNVPDHPLIRMGRDMQYVAEFLDNGYPGWALYKLPDNFFSNVLPEATEFVDFAQALGLQPGCHILKHIANIAFFTRQRLRWMRMVRGNMGKAKYYGQLAKEQAKELENLRLTLEGTSLRPGFEEQMEMFALEASEVECETTETEQADKGVVEGKNDELNLNI